MLHFNKSHEKILEGKSLNIVRENDFLAVDTLKIDDHLRLRFSKKTRNIFPVRPGDDLAIFQNNTSKTIIFNLQREGRIVDAYQFKRLSKDDRYDFQTNPLEIQDISNTQFRLLKSKAPHQAINESYHHNQGQVDVSEERSDIKKLISARYDNYLTALTDDRSISTLKFKRPVMIVDDESDILLSYSKMLEQHDIDCETFTNSFEALLRFTEVTPSYYDLVILDIKMPGLNGLQLYKLMKAQQKDTRFLFVSDLDYATEFMEMVPDINIRNILTKPIDGNALLRRVSEMP